LCDKITSLDFEIADDGYGFTPGGTCYYDCANNSGSGNVNEEVDICFTPDCVVYLDYSQECSNNNTSLMKRQPNAICDFMEPVPPRRSIDPVYLF
jgi:hypothetical protein